MSDESMHEQLSALADGELERETSRFLLRRLEREPELAARFGRYQMIRTCLRREDAPLAPPDFADKVMAALADEQPRRNRFQEILQSRFLRPVAGGAIAAAVAAMALIATTPMQPDMAPTVAVTPVRPASALLLPPTVVAQPVAGRFSEELAPVGPVQSAIEAYLVRHSGAVANAGSGGPFVYAPALQPDGAADPNLRQAKADAGR